jgi:hypothetical protein
MNQRVEAAREYWKRGWLPIPLLKDKKTPNLHKGHEFLRRWPTKEEASKFDFQNVGIVCGEVSGICVLDIDVMDRLDTLDSPIPPTFRVKTPRGMHFYFKYDSRVKTTTAVQGKGIDIRSDGSYVVAPPSVVDNHMYVWEMNNKLYSDAELAEPPEWMYASRKQDAYVSSSPKPIEGQYIGEGERDNSITSLAGFLHTKIHNVEWVLFLCKQFNDHYVRPPLPDADIERIVYGTKHRYHNV